MAGGIGGMLWPLLGGVALLFRSLFSLFWRFLPEVTLPPPLPGVVPVFADACSRATTGGEAQRDAGALLGPLLPVEATGEDNELVGVAFISGCNIVN